MTDPRFAAGISEKRGFVVYSFIDLHLKRAACPPPLFVADRNRRLPRYVAADDSGVRLAGAATAQDYPNADSYSAADAIAWLAHNDEHRRLTARIIGQAKTEFEKRFDSQGFLVLFLNGATSADQMMPLLTPFGIQCLDYRNLLGDRCGDEPCIQPNWRPTAGGNRVIAVRLAEELAQRRIAPQ